MPDKQASQPPLRAISATSGNLSPPCHRRNTVVRRRVMSASVTVTVTRKDREVNPAPGGRNSTTAVTSAAARKPRRLRSASSRNA